MKLIELNSRSYFNVEVISSIKCIINYSTHMPASTKRSLFSEEAEEDNIDAHDSGGESSSSCNSSDEDSAGSLVDFIVDSSSCSDSEDSASDSSSKDQEPAKVIKGSSY